ncbi:MAG: SCF ubiquitin ligase complex subunit cdc4 [Alyxoria varia]|nr:MAG: SCF ubiquitin ligase complex subunit cdc4 [Alyxoria varia]
MAFQASRPRSRKAQAEPAPALITTPHVEDVSKTAESAVVDNNNSEMAQPGFAVGQLSFAPATQTTVVTTTTTTTTTFPPFEMNPPKNLRDRDPEDFPLASSPTPESIRRLEFEIDGKVARFEEASTPTNMLKEYERTQNSLRKHNGTLEHVARPSSHDDPSTLEGSHVAKENSRKRSATPTPLADAVELDSFHRRNKVPKLKSPEQSKLGASRLKEQQTVDKKAGNEKGDCVSDITKCTPPPAEHLPEPSFANNTVGQSGGASADDQPGADGAVNDNSETDVDTSGLSSRPQELQRISALPNNLNTASVQDASLPSPSLSPITASANLHRTRTRGALGPDQLASETDYPKSNLELVETSSSNGYQTPHESSIQPFPNHLQYCGSQFQAPTPSCIPDMLDAFDSFPEQMKKYVMFQMLRRCSKDALHFVAAAVDPALRCDFLGRLPLEMSYHILQYLDAKTLCRAAQVSRRWRQIIDSNERAWKALIDADGFQLAPGEVQQAIHEGWGWQFPGCEITNGHGSEQHQVSARSDGQSPSNLCMGKILASNTAGASSDVVTYSNSPPKRKRKSQSSKVIGQHKKQKRRMTCAQTKVLAPSWIEGLDKRQGPVALAGIAASVQLVPDVGYVSLKNLHLFKSLYQKHHTMHQSWMKSDTQPRHLAFRARQRHVVTCLQFDDDKIITGSDDSNIDIYDTKSGCVRLRLQGHDGGVWALEYQDELLVSGSTDRSVRVWNMSNGKMLHVFQGHTSTVRCLQILKPTKVGTHADGRPILMPRHPLIITGSRDSTCRIWKLPKIGDAHFIQQGPVVNDSDNPYYLRTLQGHSNSVRAIAAHGDTLVSGSYDSFVRVWRVSTGECVHRLQGHTSKVYSVVLDHARNRCISGSMDNMVKVWDLDTGTCLFDLHGHTSLVGLLDLRDDILVSAAADATLRVWDPENGRCKKTLKAHTGAITCFLHDEQKIISGSDKSLKMWDSKTGKCVRDLLTDLSGVWQIKFDERRCVAAVQREDWTYIEVLDFDNYRDSVPDAHRGKRVVVDSRGLEIPDDHDYGVVDQDDT